MKVTCINDKNQPQGAVVVEGTKYSVAKSFVTMTGQKAYLIAGINNEGTTKMGFPWYGYSADRFAEAESDKKVVVEFDHALN